MKKIIYFSAQWCGPCKQFAPVINQLQSEGVNIQKVDVDKDNSLPAQYGVRNIPTLVLVDANGTELNRRVGTGSPTDILNFYNN